MNPFLAFGIGPWEVILILVVVLVLFGAKKLPELAKGLGQGIKEFKKASKEVQDDLHRALEEDTAGRPSARPVTTPAEPAKPESTTQSSA
ncbi:MAG: twin-arginine translocase TatA/TatE family subunit [Limisphaerales bacterium]